MTEQYLQFFIPGKPVPKGRPRSRVAGGKNGRGFVQVYTDSTTKSWEAQIQTCVRDQMASMEMPAGVLPLADRVLMTVRFYFRRPASTPKSVVFPVKSRSDVDNLAKLVLDAVQAPKDGSWSGLIVNDCIVTDLLAQKRFADDEHPEGTVLQVTGLG